MNFKFRIKRLVIRWNRLLLKKAKLLPDQQNVLDNWTKLLHDKNTKPYFCRVKDERVVVLFEDEQETILRKMIILKDTNSSEYYELLYTEVKPDGSKTIIDTELDQKIARVFIDRFDEVIYRRIANLEKLRKNLMNQSMGLTIEEMEILSIHEQEPKLLKDGIKIPDSVKLIKEKRA
jgi:hypothetical protein